MEKKQPPLLEEAYKISFQRRKVDAVLYYAGLIVREVESETIDEFKAKHLPYLKKVEEILKLIALSQEDLDRLFPFFSPEESINETVNHIITHRELGRYGNFKILDQKITILKKEGEPIDFMEVINTLPSPDKKIVINDLRYIWLLQEIVEHFIQNANKYSSYQIPIIETTKGKTSIEMNSTLLPLDYLRTLFLQPEDTNLWGDPKENAELLNSLQLGEGQTFLVHMQHSGKEDSSLPLIDSLKELLQKVFPQPKSSLPFSESLSTP